MFTIFWPTQIWNSHFFQLFVLARGLGYHSRGIHWLLQRVLGFSGRVELKLYSRLWKSVCSIVKVFLLIACGLEILVRNIYPVWKKKYCDLFLHQTLTQNPVWTIKTCLLSNFPLFSRIISFKRFGKLTTFQGTLTFIPLYISWYFNREFLYF